MLRRGGLVFCVIYSSRIRFKGYELYGNDGDHIAAHGNTGCSSGIVCHIYFDQDQAGVRLGRNSECFKDQIQEEQQKTGRDNMYRYHRALYGLYSHSDSKCGNTGI